MGKVQGYNTPEPTGLDFDTGVKGDVAWVKLRWDAPKIGTEQWTTTENGDYSTSIATLPVSGVLENSIWWRVENLLDGVFHMSRKPSTEFKALFPGRRYTFRVCKVDTQGAGPWSQQVTVTTPTVSGGDKPPEQEPEEHAPIQSTMLHPAVAEDSAKRKAAREAWAKTKVDLHSMRALGFHQKDEIETVAKDEIEFQSSREKHVTTKIPKKKQLDMALEIVKDPGSHHPLHSAAWFVHELYDLPKPQDDASVLHDLCWAAEVEPEEWLGEFADLGGVTLMNRNLVAILNSVDEWNEADGELLMAYALALYQLVDNCQDILELIQDDDKACLQIVRACDFLIRNPRMCHIETLMSFGEEEEELEEAIFADNLASYILRLVFAITYDDDLHGMYNVLHAYETLRTERIDLKRSDHAASTEQRPLFVTLMELLHAEGEGEENGKSIDCLVNVLKLINAFFEPWETYPTELEGLEHRMQLRAHLTAQGIHEAFKEVLVRVIHEDTRSLHQRDKLLLIEGLTELYLERERDDLALLKKRVPMAALDHSDHGTAIEIAAELAFMKESIAKGGSVAAGDVAVNVERSMVAVMNKGTEGMYDEIQRLRRDVTRERRGRLRALMRLALGAFSHGFLHHSSETGEINQSMAKVADQTLIAENQRLANASSQQSIEIMELSTALRGLKETPKTQQPPPL